MKTWRGRVAAAGLVAVAACGGEGGEPAPAAEAPAGELSGAKFGLLTSGPVSDDGWYAGAYEGLMLLRDSLGAEVGHQQTATPAEFDEAFRAYANEGYDVVF